MSHAGDLTPTEAYELLQRDPDAVLVDVRTKAEWSYVGTPVAPGRDVVLVEWQTFPAGTPNTRFLEQLEAAGVRRAVPIAFICRSGVRSLSAARAATAAGFGPAYNVSDGFEGPLDPQGHRGVRGWKASGLPWRQS